MSDDKLAFLDDQPAAATPEPQAAPTPEPTPEPKAEAAPAQKQEAAKDDPKDGRERDPETGRYVPPGLLEERRKRQALEQQLREMQAQRQNQPEQPAITEDPNEWGETLTQHLTAQQMNTRLDISEMLARDKHGDDSVDEAVEAFKMARLTDPMLQTKMLNDRNPYGFVLNWHKQHKLLSDIGQDPEAWRQRETERLRQEVLKELQGQGVATSRSSSQPPPSMVGRPAAASAGSIPQGPGVAFDNLFKG